MEVPPLALLRLQRPMGLSNEPTKLLVINVRDKREIMSSHMYAVPLLNMEGKNVCFQVYGRDKISIEVQRKNLNNIKCLFQGLTGSDMGGGRWGGRQNCGKTLNVIFRNFHPYRL